MNISRDSLSNRRLYMKNTAVLIDFSQPDTLSHVTVEGCAEVSVQNLPKDMISEGECGLRTLAAREEDGQFLHRQTATYAFDTPRNLSASPLITFAHSAYDGPLDSL